MMAIHGYSTEWYIIKGQTKPRKTFLANHQTNNIGYLKRDFTIYKNKLFQNLHFCRSQIKLLPSILNILRYQIHIHMRATLTLRSRKGKNTLFMML